VQRHHVGKRHLPQIIEADKHFVQHGRQIVNLLRRQIGQTLVRLLRHHERFVGIAGEVGNEGDRRIVLTEDAAPVGALGGDDVFQQHPILLVPVTLRDGHFVFDRLEDEIRRVDLAVGVRVGNADHLTLVLECEHVVHFRTGAEFPILRLPDPQQVGDLRHFEFGQRDVVPRAVADNASHPLGWPMTIDARSRLNVVGSLRPDAGEIVVEYEDVRVGRILPTTHPDVSGTERTVGDVIGHRLGACRGRLPCPRPIVAVGGHDDPFFPQRMPALLPDHGNRLEVLSAIEVLLPGHPA